MYKMFDVYGGVGSDHAIVIRFAHHSSCHVTFVQAHLSLASRLSLRSVLTLCLFRYTQSRKAAFACNMVASSTNVYQDIPLTIDKLRHPSPSSLGACLSLISLRSIAKSRLSLNARCLSPTPCHSQGAMHSTKGLLPYSI